MDPEALPEAFPCMWGWWVGPAGRNFTHSENWPFQQPSRCLTARSEPVVCSPSFAVVPQPGQCKAASAKRSDSCKNRRGSHSRRVWVLRQQMAAASTSIEKIAHDLQGRLCLACASCWDTELQLAAYRWKSRVDGDILRLILRVVIWLSLLVQVLSSQLRTWFWLSSALASIITYQSPQGGPTMIRYRFVTSATSAE